MPSDMDIATVYVTVKARLGMSLSRDRTTTSTSQNPPRHPPSISQTQAPLRTPEPTPVVPHVQYSGDDSEEEGWAQPAAVSAEKALSVPPPHAEGTTAPNTPTPPSGGGPNSPTLLGPTQPIKVVHIDDDSTEDLLPPPSEILQGDAEWTFIPHAEYESVPDREEEPLHRRTRRMEVNRLMEEVEARVASMQRVEEEQVERPRIVRSILNEPKEPENLGAVGEINEGASEADEERMAVEDSQVKIEREEKEREGECSSSSEEDAARNPGHCGF